MKAELFDRLRADRAAKRPVALCTALPGGAQHLCHLQPGDADGPATLPDEVLAAARLALARDEAITVDTAGGAVFVQPFNPPLRLVLVGAVHIAQPLARMAALAGFAVVIVDPRAAFSTEARFPGVERSTEWPDRALAALALDRRTAVVTLTHDPKLDDPALETALGSPAFYVGCLGSGKTHRSRLGRLERRGFGEADLQRLRGPVGLRIGARSPAEIAVSILAQIIETLRGAGAPPAAPPA